MGFLRDIYRDKYTMPETDSVRIYAWEPATLLQRRLPPVNAPRPFVSLIATVKDEGRTIRQWFESILAQSRVPDEIVIVDGGSSDDTTAILRASATHCPIPVRLLECHRANIARGRNVAIEAAAGPVIACADAGCILPVDWLAAITGPFVDDEVEVVAGYYRVASKTGLETAVAAYFVKPVDQIDPRSFLPSARSMAFTKEAWSRAGGFPEWLERTAEDTLFDLKLKSVTRQWAFVPEAQVEWRAQSTLRGLFGQVERYAHGDGEAGLFPTEYRRRINLWLGLMGAAMAGAGGIVLSVVWRSPYWLLVTAASVLVLTRRIIQITLRPTWPTNRFDRLVATCQSALVVLTITLAMGIGFIRGVYARRRRAATL